MGDTYIDGVEIPSRPPNCLKCIHFKVTWDPKYPRACELFSIKCTVLPSQEIFRATHTNCPAFHLKEGIK